MALGRSELDICDPQSVAAALDRHQPSTVIHAAAMTRVDDCTRNRARAFRVNAGGTEVVAQAWEIRRGLDENADAFLESVRTGENVRHAVATRQDPFVHRARKLGRNDPCSCGSGKKYKKCHGRDA